jgi:septal ring-binding cell division protein DamX
MIQFNKRAIVFIFILFIGVTTLVFSMGIFIGGSFVDTVSQLRKGSQNDALPLNAEMIDESVNAEISDESKKTEPPLQTQALPELRGFTIQVSVVENYEEAAMEIERLKRLGFPTVSIQEALVENRKWFFVNLGYFQNEKKAFALASHLRQKGMLSSFLIRKSEIHEEN